jgi:hypothetical protein
VIADFGFKLPFQTDQNHLVVLLKAFYLQQGKNCNFEL